MFSSELATGVLIELCRSARHQLDAGLGLVDVFRQQAKRGPAPIRPLAERILRKLEKGGDLASAIEADADFFPDLFRELVRVGEQTGNLPDVFAALQKHYEGQQRLSRLFRTQIMMPVMQFFAGVFVIAGLIFVLGWIAEAKSTQPIDPLGLGLIGASGAIIFLLIVFGTLGLLAGLYFFAQRNLKHQKLVDETLLRVPVLGPTLEALALGRFCLALRLTLDSSMSASAALALSLRATGNAAYASRADSIGRQLRKGKQVAPVLTRENLFPEDFAAVVASAEESGRLPEAMRQQAKQYEGISELRLRVLTRAAGFGVWLVVAMLMIFAIYQIFTRVYLSQLQV